MSNTLNITLSIGGAEKNYTTTPNGRAVRNATALYQKMKVQSLTPEFMDEMATFVVDMFKNQFTIDDLYDGLDAGSLGKVLIGKVNEVVDMFYKKAFELPNAEAGRQ